MSKLLSAGFDRLFKNKLFHTAIIVMFALGCFAGHTKWSDFSDGFKVDLADALFTYCLFGACVTAVLSSMFSGTEYSDGTIRNKLIAGCSRINIYLSNLIINFVSGIAAVVAFVVPYVAICLLTVGKSSVPVKVIMLSVLLSMLCLAAFSAIYNAVTMLIAKKAAAAVACLLLFAGLYIVGMTTYAKLGEPEFVSGYELNDEGEIVETEPVPNPDYLTGTKLKAYQWMLDINPGSQAIQIISMEIARPVRLSCCAGAIMVIFTLAGAVIFSKKDLK